MKKEKICPRCGRSFVTDVNSRKFCGAKCAAAAKRSNAKKSRAKYVCQWCAVGFDSARKRKFCSEKCRSTYMRKKGLILKKTMKIPLKITLTDAVTMSRKEGISYGRYITLHKIK